MTCQQELFLKGQLNKLCKMKCISSLPNQEKILKLQMVKAIPFS